MSTLLSLRGIGKKFGDFVALAGVDLEIGAGEVVGVLGENGAGKSTLMNIASGLLQPDQGEIRVDGIIRRFAGPRDAAAAGIGMVHQHYLLVPNLTVTENVMLGDPRLDPLRPRLAAHAAEIGALAHRIGLDIDPNERIDRLDMGGRQRVEIVKALHRGARVLILDEPTTVLSERERLQLYGVIRALKAEGVGLVLISHKLDDIYEVCDRVLVLRAGHMVDQAPLAERNREALVRSMVGEDIAPGPAKSGTVGAAVLAVSDLAVRKDNGTLAFSKVTFELRAGEILALAGVEGNGQEELAETLAGLRHAEHGIVAIDAKPLDRHATALRRRKRGLRHVPHDRHRRGVLAARPLAENFLLSHWFDPAFRRRGWLRRRRAKSEVAAIASAFELRGGTTASLRALSGGNQQKLVVGRELWGESRVLVAAHPTRGLDVRTVAALQERLVRRRNDGLAILLISSDLAEIWQVADRVMVLSHGRLHGPVPIAETSTHQVGSWISGA
ncbi:MAG: ABC transporter ATP-binding protein [Rhodospirillaceae bacterium]|nr:ABC transporter ATP-binding protein [Rhodospirillaceae bacterium]